MSTYSLLLPDLDDAPVLTSAQKAVVAQLEYTNAKARVWNRRRGDLPTLHLPNQRQLTRRPARSLHAYA